MTSGTQSYVVLGGTSSVAKALAQRIHAAGGNLLLTTRDESSASELAEQFSCEAAVARADDSASIDAAVHLAMERFGKINGVVNCMGSVLLKPAQSAAAASTQMHALCRLGEPDDIAKAIAWLLDSENNWITGQTIAVDGGLSTVVPRPKV